MNSAESTFIARQTFLCRPYPHRHQFHRCFPPQLPIEPLCCEGTPHPWDAAPCTAPGEDSSLYCCLKFYLQGWQDKVTEGMVKYWIGAKRSSCFTCVCLQGQKRDVAACTTLMAGDRPRRTGKEGRGMQSSASVTNPQQQ